MKQTTVKLMKLTLASVLAASLFAGCNKYVYDDMGSCNRGVYLKIYTQTECADQPSYLNLSDVDVFVFDEQGLLANSLHFDRYDGMQKEELLIPIPKEGRYDICAWSGVGDKFIREKFQIGKTSKRDLFTTIKSHNKLAVELGAHRVYATPHMKRTILGKDDHLFVHDSVNVGEITNRVSVRVVGFDHPEDYEVQLLSNNGKYGFDAKIIKDLQLSYPADMQFVPNEKYPNEKDLFAEFTTLLFKTGYNNELVIRNKKKGTEPFREDLIALVLMSKNAKNINLECLHDFDVRIDVKKCHCPDGYMAVDIYVNDWLVHSYDAELGE